MKVVAVGYQRKWPWEEIVIIGYGFAGIIVVAIPAILITVSDLFASYTLQRLVDI